jgi:hypothetical protein
VAKTLNPAAAAFIPVIPTQAQPRETAPRLEIRKRSVKDTPRTGIDYAEASLSGLPRFQGNKAS